MRSTTETFDTGARKAIPVRRRLRVDEARRLLESTPLPLKDISIRTGLGDVSTLWGAFTKVLAVTPAEYRERFTR